MDAAELETFSVHENQRHDTILSVVKEREKKETSKAQKYVTGIRIMMCMNALIECFGEAMIVPYYPRAMDIDEGWFGTLMAIEAIFKVVTSVLVGVYIVELGPKKCMVYSYTLNAFSMLLMGTNHMFTNTYWRTLVALVSFTTQGISVGGFITASYTIILDVFPKTFSVEVGFYELFSGLASAVAPLIAGAALQLISDNFIWIGLFGFLLGLACMTVALLTLEEISNCRPSQFKQALKLLQSSSILFAFLSVLLGMGVIYALGAVIERKISQYVDDSEPFLVGLPWSTLGIVYACLSPVWGKVSESKPRMTMVLSGALLALTCFLYDGRWILRYLGLENSSVGDLEAGFIYLCIISGFVGGLVPAPIIASYQEMSDVTHNELEMPANLATNGLISACWNLGYSLSNVSGPLIFGLVAKYVDFYWSMRIYGVCLVLLVLPMLVYYQRNPRE